LLRQADHDWLVFGRPVASAVWADPERCLSRAGEAATLTKPAVAPGRGGALRADWPAVAGFERDGRLDARMAWLTADFRHTTALHTAGRANGYRPPPAPPRDLSELCRAAGWACDPRKSGLVLRLRIANEFAQARLSLDPGGLLVAETELLADYPGTAAPSCRKAACLFGLCLNTAVRMARVVAGGRGRSGLWLEVVWPQDVTPDELSAGLEALSVAVGWRPAARELWASESIAGHYLRLMGYNAP
jgi:hypothetical protein